VPAVVAAAGAGAPGDTMMRRFLAISLLLVGCMSSSDRAVAESFRSLVTRAAVAEARGDSATLHQLTAGSLAVEDLALLRRIYPTLGSDSTGSLLSLRRKPNMHGDTVFVDFGIGRSWAWHRETLGTIFIRRNGVWLLSRAGLPDRI
jgi:hypothetical protein